MASSPSRSTLSEDQFDQLVLKKARKGPSKWSPEEEEQFLEILNTLAKSGIWATAKENGVLARRGSDGVKKHWDAMYKKMKGGK